MRLSSLGTIAPEIPIATEWMWRGWLITATADAPSGLFLVRINPSGIKTPRSIGTAVTLAMAESAGRSSIDHRIRQLRDAFDDVTHLEAGMFGAV